MKFDWTLEGGIGTASGAATAVEADGYDGLWVGETNHDPFLSLVRAADATERVSIGTAIAIAFARTPMTLAYLAYDLQEASTGRFVLGLGSQVKPHIERRFSMPWSHPAARMRELVLAMRAIWSSWEDGTKLDFRGDFYTHSLMTPFFAPPKHTFGPPPVFLAGVGELMTEVAGEVADGFFFHAFTTPHYLKTVTVPALEKGRAKTGKALTDFQICGPAFAATGRTDEEIARGIEIAKDRIAFYASTPSYRGVLEAHGWGDLQGELGALVKQGRWAEMGGLISDEVFDAFAVAGSPEEVGRALHDRFGDVASRLTFYPMGEQDPQLWREVLAASRSAG
ncbi:MAG: putative N5,N10-methylenetetrahydromethanopterin reductase-related protein [Actinomycetia bacterium]|nr:putative N5,N10-methylenetetrahydromethanopterin reductase-related protein [Actinomycetes bacterium]